MLDELYPIIFLSVLTIICIMAIVFICVRTKNKSSLEDETDFIDDALEKKNKKLREQPGAPKLKNYLLMGAICVLLIGTLTFLFSHNLTLTVILAISAAFIPELYVRNIKQRSIKNFEERYVKALSHLASSLRSGLSIQQAISEICKSPFINYEMKKEFKRIDSDIKLGIPVADAFKNMSERIGTNDVKDVAAAIAMGTNVGGSEAEAIEDIANNIHSRLMLKREINSLFAGTKVTVIGMEILPWIIILIMYVSNKEYFSICKGNLFAEIGIVISLLVMVIGTFVIMHIYKKSKEI